MPFREFFNRPDVAHVLNLFCAPMLLTHELGHYIPACLFGLHPELHWRGVGYGKTTWARNMVITLCPSLVGILILLIGGWLALVWASWRSERLFALALSAFGFGVWISGGRDWIDAWNLIKSKEKHGN